VTAKVRQQHADICLGRTPLELGDLLCVRDGRREYSSFTYRPGWLSHRERFQVSPDLPLTRFDYLAAVDDESRIGALRL